MKYYFKLSWIIKLYKQNLKKNIQISPIKVILKKSLRLIKPSTTSLKNKEPEIFQKIFKISTKSLWKLSLQSSRGCYIIQKQFNKLCEIFHKGFEISATYFTMSNYSGIFFIFKKIYLNFLCYTFRVFESSVAQFQLTFLPYWIVANN